MLNTLEVKETMVTAYEKEIRRLREEVVQLRSVVAPDEDNPGAIVKGGSSMGGSSMGARRSCKVSIKVVCAVGLVIWVLLFMSN